MEAFAKDIEDKYNKMFQERLNNRNAEIKDLYLKIKRLKDESKCNICVELRKDVSWLTHEKSYLTSRVEYLEKEILEKSGNG